METYEFTYCAEALISTKVKAKDHESAEEIARERLERRMRSIERRCGISFGDPEDWIGFT